MPNNSQAVRSGAGKVGGYLFHAPLGTTKPTDAATALDAAFKLAGFVSSDGIQRSGTTENDDWTDMNGDVVRTVQSETGEQFEFALMETNETSLGIVFGDSNVTVTAGVAKVEFTGEPLPHGIWVIELVDGEFSSRILIHDAQVINPGGGDQELTKQANMAWPVTLKGYRDPTTKSFSTRWYELPAA